jgi:hypothetical protein
VRFDLAAMFFDGIVATVFMPIQTRNSRNFGETAASGFLASGYTAAGIVSRSFHTQGHSGIDNRYSQADTQGTGNRRKSLEIS